MIAPLTRIVTAGVISLTGVAGPATAGDEQGRIADALASSSLRLLEAGFWAVGPGEQDSAFVSACLGGVDAPGRLALLPGEVARGISKVYLYQPDADGSPQIGELLTVAVFTVDEPNRDTLDRFVLLLGSPDAAECRRDEFLRAQAADPGSAGVEAVVSVEATADLLVGDASSRVDVSILFTRLGDEQPVRYSYLVSRIDRTLVVLRSARFGPGPFSVVDPRAELSAVVETLAAA